MHKNYVDVTVKRDETTLRWQLTPAGSWQQSANKKKREWDG
jgi:hypothetical protein